MTVKYLPNDVVLVRGYASAPVRLTSTAWMNITRQAIATSENAIGNPANIEATRAGHWLQARRYTARMRLTD